MTTYAQTVRHLRAAGLSVRELRGQGCVAVTPAAGRVIALAFAEAGDNVFWTHPDLNQIEVLKATPEKLAGGIGGERLWFSPEADYHWHGTPDWTSFANYHVPQSVDPGTYSFSAGDEGAIVLGGTIVLPTTSGAAAPTVRVRREIRMASPPLLRSNALLDGVEFTGIETRHELELDPAVRTGRVALWHLVQIPVGSLAIVPLRRGSVTAPLSYANPGSWVVNEDHVAWRYGGVANAKFGLSVDAVTGRSAVLRRLNGGQWCLIVRDFPVEHSARYADHPWSAPRHDQVLQAWDGFGFGELEYHSPALDAGAGPRRLVDSDTLYAFAGSAAAMGALAVELLGVGIDRYLT